MQVRWLALRRAGIAMVLHGGLGLMMTSLEAAEPVYQWKQSETQLALCKGEKVVWQLVADPKKPKVYFHPLATVDGEVLTVAEPADHLWHRGLWFSWKFINGVNYWEENPQTHVSDGATELTGVVFKPAENFGAKVEISLSYHLPGEASLMTERRLLSITPPDVVGAYRIDWESEFTVGNAPVNLGRTPLPNEEGGKDYGGYAGLSARLLLKPDGWTILTRDGPGKAPDFHGKNARWMDFSSSGAGIAICDHPSNLRSPSPWYVHDQKPMSYFSPAVLYREPLVLAAGQSLKLKYRVLVHSKSMTAAQLDADFKNFTGETQP